MTKHTILFLAANPSGTDRLALDREAHAIQLELDRSSWRDRFEFVTRWAVEPLDLLRELRKLRPAIVHFSGHGATGRAMDQQVDPVSTRVAFGKLALSEGEPCEGLYFQDSDGSPRVVLAAALRDAFGAAGPSVRLVVLNACYSDAAAEALLTCVDCVVGMPGPIRDESARSYAIGLYGGLGERESIEAAHRGGCAAIGLQGLPEASRPRLRLRPGMDASKLVLAERDYWRGGGEDRPEQGSREIDVPVASIRSISRPENKIGSMGATSSSADSPPLTARKQQLPRRVFWLAAAGCIIVACGVFMVARPQLIGLRGKHVPDDGVTPVAAAIPAGASLVAADTSLEDGVNFWRGLGGAKDIQRSYAIFSSSCKDGNSTGCQNALHALFHGVTGKRNELAALSRACDVNAAPCVAQALITDDPPRARRSCDTGVPSGCLVASLSFAKDKKMRDADFQRAFDMLSDDGMIDAGFLRGFMVAFGLGMRRDAAQARQLVARACATGDSAACELLECLDFGDDLKARMDRLVKCYQDGVLPEYLVRLGKEALVREALEGK